MKWCGARAYFLFFMGLLYVLIYRKFCMNTLQIKNQLKNSVAEMVLMPPVAPLFMPAARDALFAWSQSHSPP